MWPCTSSGKWLSCPWRRSASSSEAVTTPPSSIPSTGWRRWWKPSPSWWRSSGTSPTRWTPPIEPQALRPHVFCPKLPHFCGLWCGSLWRDQEGGRTLWGLWEFCGGRCGRAKPWNSLLFQVFHSFRAPYELLRHFKPFLSLRRREKGSALWNFPVKKPSYRPPLPPRAE